MLRRTIILTLTFALLATTSAGLAVGLEAVDDDDESSTLDSVSEAVNDSTANETSTGLTASTCTVDREANQVTCPAPPTCEEDEDCHLPDACSLQGSTLVCPIDNERETSEPSCRASTEDGALIECDIPSQCDDRIGERGCAIPPSCTVGEDRLYCNPPAPRDDDEDTRWNDCRPLNDTTLTCSPPAECLDDTNKLLDTQACSLPSKCEPTQQDHYRCTVQTTNTTPTDASNETIDADQDHADDDVRPRLYSTIRDHFQPYRASVQDAQQAHLDHRESLQERFDEAKDDLRQAYADCLDETTASGEEHRGHQRTCLQDAREGLEQERTALREEDLEHRESLREDLETTRQETCRSLEDTLQGALKQAGLQKQGLQRILAPSHMPLCSSLFLEGLPYDGPVQAIGDTEAGTS